MDAHVISDNTARKATLDWCISHGYQIPRWLKERGISCPFNKGTIFKGRHGDINCRKVGEGDHVVLTFHGFNASHSAFDVYSDILGANNYTVVSFDLYGHGLSATPRYRVFGKTYSADFFVDQADEVIDYLELQDRKITVMGISMGACIAVAYCKRHTRNVERMILISPVGFIPSKPCIVRAIRVFHCFIPCAPYCVCRCCFPKRSQGKRMEQMTNHVLWRFFVTPKSTASILGMVKRVPMWDSRGMYRMVGKLNKPTLIVFGEMDKVTPPSAAPMFKEMFSNSHVIIIPNACHLVSYLMPTEIASICLATLNIPASEKLSKYHKWLPFSEEGKYIPKKERTVAAEPAQPSTHVAPSASMDPLIENKSDTVTVQNKFHAADIKSGATEVCNISREGLEISSPTPVVMVTIEDALKLHAFSLVHRRFKTVKVSAYRRPARASPTGQARKAHIGIKRLSAEYVTPGQVLVKQRKPLAQNINVTRNRHFKIYPGENVGVSSKTTTLFALVPGRVKYTHDVNRNIKLVNVLPEPPDELLRDDLWRYRTEHVSSIQDNCALVWRRVKRAYYMYSLDNLVNPPFKPPPRPNFLSRHDPWNNQAYPNIPLNYRFPPK